MANYPVIFFVFSRNVIILLNISSISKYIENFTFSIYLMFKQVISGLLQVSFLKLVMVRFICAGSSIY